MKYKNVEHVVIYTKSGKVLSFVKKQGFSLDIQVLFKESQGLRNSPKKSGKRREKS